MRKSNRKMLVDKKKEIKGQDQEIKLFNLILIKQIPSKFNKLMLIVEELDFKP